MQDTEILQKAIERALRNGWKHVGMQLAIDKGLLQWDETNWSTFYESDAYYAQIFSHDFAKAFWGEPEYEYASNGEKTDIKNRGWQYHLQMMVLQENPIKYLEKFLR